MNRRIATTTQQASRQIRDVLQSVLVCEFLAPPDRLWLVSAWIVDAPVIDNRSGELAVWCPSGPIARSCFPRSSRSSSPAGPR